MSWSAATSVRPWDDGITTRHRLVTPPSGQPLVSPSYFAENVLRVANDTNEDDVVERLLLAAEAAAERKTKLCLREQTWEIVLSGFPWGGIRLPRSPVIAITGVSYYDENNEIGTLAGSPAEYLVSPSGEIERAVLSPLVDASWPSTATRNDAVTVTFTAGFSDQTHPRFQLIRQGVELFAAELYKQRTLSVQQPNNTAAVLNLDYFWETVF